MMVPRQTAGLRVLVVKGPGPVATDLLNALHLAGMRVRQVGLDQLPGGDHTDLQSDLVLVHAGLPVSSLAAIGTHVRAYDDEPSVMAYTDDPVVLGPYLNVGRHYLVPPFQPMQLGHELTACRAPGEAMKARDELNSQADLLRYEGEMQIGREIQEGFFPESLPSPPGWELEARFRPAREVAGDFYDGFDLVHHRRVGFVIADVCDKGLGAALFMSLVRTLIRYSAEQQIPAHMIDPRDESLRSFSTFVDQDAASGRRVPQLGSSTLFRAVSETSGYLLRNHERQGYFATLFFGLLDPVSGALNYINAGHNPPVLLTASGQQRLLDPTGPAVGMLSDLPFSMGRADMAPGDLLFAYTDGVTDAKDEEGRFFTARRMRSLLRVDDRSAGGLLDHIQSHVDRHIGQAPQFDDITMLALRRQPIAL
jgi:sigma-B regulation protein RsbU (phosphoserine phosphatase)